MNTSTSKLVIWNRQKAVSMEKKLLTGGSQSLGYLQKRVEQNGPRARIVLLQDYHHNLLLGITSGDTVLVMSLMLAAVFMIWTVGHSKPPRLIMRGGACISNTSNLEGALQAYLDTSHGVPGRFLIRWAGVLEPKPQKTGAIKVSGCVDPYGNGTLSL